MQLSGCASFDSELARGEENMMAAVNRWILGAYTRFSSEDEGQTMAEYGLILAVIAVIAVGAFILLGGVIDSKVSSIAGTFDGSV